MSLTFTVLCLVVNALPDGDPNRAEDLSSTMGRLDQAIIQAQNEGRQDVTTVVTLPAPFRADEAESYLAVLNPDDTEREHLKQAFVEFQDAHLSVQTRLIPKIWNLAARDPGATPEERVSLTKEWSRLTADFDRESGQLEARLFAQWREVLDKADEFDREVFLFVQSDRLRVRYSTGVRLALPEAKPDLIELVRSCLSMDETPDAAITSLRHYAAERGHVLRNRFRQRNRMSAQDAELLVRHRDGELDWHEFLQRRTQYLRRIVAIDGQLERLNQNTLAILEKELEEQKAQRLLQRYREIAYPDLFPDKVDDTFRATVGEWLEEHAENCEAIDIVSAVVGDYERWYEDRIQRVMRQVSRAEREFFTHLTSNVFEEDKKEEAIASFRRDRDERIERITTLLRELSEDEIESNSTSAGGIDQRLNAAPF